MPLTASHDPCRNWRKGGVSALLSDARGSYHGVEFLVEGSDEELIRQATMVLKDHASQGIDGVEVWSGKRFVYRYPPPKAESNSN